jgi:hypothetical protein
VDPLSVTINAQEGGENAAAVENSSRAIRYRIYRKANKQEKALASGKNLCHT